MLHERREHVWCGQPAGCSQRTTRAMPLIAYETPLAYCLTPTAVRELFDRQPTGSRLTIHGLRGRLSVVNGCLVMMRGGSRGNSARAADRSRLLRYFLHAGSLLRRQPLECVLQYGRVAHRPTADPSRSRQHGRRGMTSFVFSFDVWLPRLIRWCSLVADRRTVRGNGGQHGAGSSQQQGWKSFAQQADLAAGCPHQRRPLAWWWDGPGRSTHRQGPIPFRRGLL